MKIDAISTLMRCRATREIRTGQGLIRCFTEGVIQSDIENHGRHLVQVRWNSGVTDYARLSEIEILGQEAAPSTDAHECVIDSHTLASAVE